MVQLKQVLAFVLTWGMLIATSPSIASAEPSAAMYPPVSGIQGSPPANVPAADIDAIVAPIALYPDALVAQILAGATYPDQITEADKWLKSNANLQGEALMQAVDKQPWDPSVKALTGFPSVLDNLANNLSWTSALGDVSYNQQADVMAAIQRLRKQAKDAGNLKPTSQMTVVQQNPQTIVIQPANPTVVYVPTYNPTVVYGTPYYPPGYSTGAMVATGLISFGVGMAVGAALSNSCCGWGWNSWGCGWHGGTVVYNRNVYVSRSNVYANGNRYNYNSGRYANGNRPTNYPANVNRSGNRNTNVSGNTVNINGGNRNNVNNANNGNRNNNVNRGNNTGGYGTNRTENNNANRPAASTRPSASPDRGYGQRPATGTQTGAFSGYGTGGSTRAQSNRGQWSMGGGQRSAPARSGGGRRR
ncbi:MAG TPA: DUF3300 domain-containing protein [Terriglobales bacterium]|jgi:hypothetical protein